MKIETKIYLLITIIFSMYGNLAADIFQYDQIISVGAYDNKPKIYFENDEYVGLFPDILNNIAQKENWKLEYIPGTWQECLDRLQKNQIDIMVDVAYSRKRSELFDFNNETYLVNWANIYVNKDKDIESLIDLNNKRIAVMKGSIHTVGENGIMRLTKQFDIDCKFVEVASYDQVFNLLKENKVDAGVVNRVYGSLFADKLNLTKTPIIFNPTHLKFAFPKNSLLAKKLIKKIDFHLKRLKEDPGSIYHKAVYVYLTGLSRDLIFNKPDIENYKALNLTNIEKEWLKEHPVIKVHSEEQWPPFNFQIRGKAVGFSVDYLNLIAEKLDINIEYIKGYSWNEFLTLLKNKKIDVMLNMVELEERREYTSFTRSYFTSFNSLYMKKGSKTISSLADIEKNGLILSVPNGFATHFLLKKLYPEIKLLVVKDQLESIKAVITGKADVLIGLEGVVNYLIDENLFSNIKQVALVTDEPFVINHSIGVRKDWEILRDIIQKVMDVIPKNEVNSLKKKWYLGFIASKNEKIDLTIEEKKWIEEHPEILLGIDPEFAPFEFFSEEDEYLGIASDYVDIIKAKTGLNLKVKKENWNKVISDTKNKKIDLLPCVGKTIEREKYLLFSKPYIDFRRVIIARTDQPFKTDLSDLRTKIISVQKNSSHEGYLKENSESDYVAYSSLQEALLAVSEGKAEAFIGNVASATYWIRKLNLTNLKIAAPVSDKNFSLHFAVRKDWPILLKIINKALATIPQNERIAIREKWINIEYKPGISKEKVWSYITRVVLLASLILLISFFWNIKLKREIRKRIEVDRLLQVANIELRKLDQLKSMFIASMSHELRTPLNSIIGFTGVILQGMTGELTDKQKDHLSRVYSSAKHLLSLITDVIDISKIEAGKIDSYPEEFSLSEVIEEAIINIQPQLQSKNLKLIKNNSYDVKLFQDHKRVLQCLINFLSNAVKYTIEGKIIIETKEVSNFDNNYSPQMVRISIIDTGIGISEKDKPKLFEAFERINSSLKIKAGGTGLGLYLTNRIVNEILKGKIVVESIVDKGSNFTLIIPVTLENNMDKT